VLLPLTWRRVSAIEISAAAGARPHAIPIATLAPDVHPPVLLYLLLLSPPPSTSSIFNSLLVPLSQVHGVSLLACR